MRWGIPSIDRVDETKWHKWFAWHPVQLTYGHDGGVWVWWEFVERKENYMDDTDYRTIRNG